MILPGQSPKDLLWLSCREKRCCYTTKVVLSGRDLWRITQALQVRPQDMTLYTNAIAGAADGFQLVAGGPAYQVILAKRGPVRRIGAPCLFLWKLNDGHHQCGLGALRPMACQTYPTVIDSGLLQVEASACSCRRWSLLDLDPAAERRLLEQRILELEEYIAIVADWNAALRAAPAEESYTSFCTYILARYRDLESPGHV
jgi:Fe-S-cluster containining protein